MKCLDNFEVSQARPMDKLFRDGGLKSQTQAWRKLENSEGATWAERSETGSVGDPWG